MIRTTANQKRQVLARTTMKRTTSITMKKSMTLRKRKKVAPIVLKTLRPLSRASWKSARFRKKNAS